MRPVPVRQLLLATLALAGRHGVPSAADTLAAYLTDRHASRRWPIIRGTLETMRQQHLTVKLELASQLDTATIGSLRSELHRRWPDHGIDIQPNPNLLGGFRLHRGTSTSDYSLATRLQQVKKALEATHG